MDKQLAKDFFDATSACLSFLVHDHGFAAPQLAVDDAIHFAVVTFVGTHLAIECILDEREEDIDCKIARVLDGKVTSHYAVDDRGIRVRDGLAQLLRRRGIRGRLFDSVDGLSLHQRMKVTLDNFGQMLRTHGRDILADSPTALA